MYLLVVSYLLYLNWKPSFALVLLGVTLVTYFWGQILQIDGEKLKVKGSSAGRIWCSASLC